MTNTPVAEVALPPSGNNIWGKNRLLPLLWCGGMLISLNSTASDETAMPTAHIEAALTTQISAEIAQFGKKNGWPDISPAVSIQLPAGSQRLSVCEQPLTTQRRDRRHYPGGRLRYQIDCGEVWTISASAVVDYSIPVIYAARTLGKDHILIADDLVVEHRSVGQLNRPHVHTSTQAVGRRLERQVRQGSGLAADRLAPAYAIRRGATVTIVAEKGDFSATMHGTAEQNGYINDRIQVRNDRSGKRIKATVVNSTTVTTHF
ncbi:flagellar basal body P-ring formation chaperone FlgA [Thaumasiovibrio sp. DFM-14]|uniref:flagellar basal body P-ring formation chaperone FlgA n=1 Tax=Thaumasiovibrio sp. DFM-14 TaxID=3384792 RepID=UPI0039A18188